MNSETFLRSVVEAIRRDRFETIKRFIHFASEDKLDKADKFWKMRPLIELIAENFRANALLSNQMCIDETMIPYYGKHSCKQFIKGKPIRFGFKLWAIANRDGYISYFEPYQGSGGKINHEPAIGVGGSVVKYLAEKLPRDYFYTVYCDRFFSRSFFAVFCFHFKNNSILA